MKPLPDDPELLHVGAPQVEDLPLWGWPERPPAPKNEQRVLPIPRVTIEARYQTWRATSDGAAVFVGFMREALEDVVAGRRLSGKHIAERVRASLRLPLNNVFTALLVREAEERFPELRGKFEKRVRKESEAA